MRGRCVRHARYGHSVAASDPTVCSADSTEDADLICLLEHWRKLSAARPSGEIPLRATASSEIAKLLKFTHLCDVIENGADFRFRIVGIAAFPNFGSLTGTLVSQHPDIGARHRFPILMREVVRTRAPVRGVSLRETEHGSYRFESIWLPFGGADVQQVLGLLSARSREI